MAIDRVDVKTSQENRHVSLVREEKSQVHSSSGSVLALMTIHLVVIDHLIRIQSGGLNNRRKPCCKHGLKELTKNGLRTAFHRQMIIS